MVSIASKAPSKLRIASLLPSTTDICIALGLQNNVVGITHECDFPSSNSIDGQSSKSTTKPSILTVSHIDPYTSTQAEIDAAVKNSLHDGLSLYNLNDKNLADAQPSVILTQSLCEVCAVAKDEVDNKVACNLPQGQCKVISLEPESLKEVADTFVTVAEACGVAEMGEQLKQSFWKGAEEVLAATQKSKRVSSIEDRPKMLFMEWVDPPFDGGHWIPDMKEQSGCASALPWAKSSRKSTQMSWEQVYECDPDLVIVACCGFDLERNEKDAEAAMKKLQPLRAFKEKRIYAANGNLYFARPGPSLKEGLAIMARCAYDGDEDVISELEKLDFLPQEGEGWSRLVFSEEKLTNSLPDLEDIVSESEAYAKLHDEACRAGKEIYIDPKTGYSVFTEVAHKRRGKCCGSGCRHCPYNHVNVKDKANKIQQPAFLYEGPESSTENTLFSPLSSIKPNSHIKVLFNSGGKDSFLAIRKVVKQKLDKNEPPFHLVLLTTFDSTSRVIAHQEVPIDTVLRQAKHLEIPLLGIPIHRQSGETYLDRIEKGLDVIRQHVPEINKLTLVFGDLHLNHVRQWREKEMSKYRLEYPLWMTPYEKLMGDLEASNIRVVLSAVTRDGVKEGMLFNRELYTAVSEKGMDGFGENGEFHSVAEVWSVSREKALGLIS